MVNSHARSPVPAPSPHSFHLKTDALSIPFRLCPDVAHRTRTDTRFLFCGPALLYFFLITTFALSPRPFLMPIATSPSLPHPATFAKMEDRKRPASGAVEEGAPPTKRQAVNGSSKSKDDSGDSREETWIEVSLTRHPFVVSLLAPFFTHRPCRSSACLDTTLPNSPSRPSLGGALLTSRQPASLHGVFAGVSALDRC